MKEILRKAPAKVNLRLKFEGRRPDGYHLLSMLNATISLADEVIITKKESGGICFSMEGPVEQLMLTKDDNTCIKAAELFFEKLGSKESVEIRLKKNIPSQAGLGGGSSDGAATLMALQELYQTDLDLVTLAKKIGSDVPFFLRGGFQFVSGIGDELQSLDFSCLEGRALTVVVPIEKISTAVAYAEIRKLDLRMEPDRKGRMFSTMASPNYEEVLKQIQNDFLEVALKLAPSLSKLFQEDGSIKGDSSHNSSGIIGLTGSGSCCFILPASNQRVLSSFDSPSFEQINCTFSR